MSDDPLADDLETIAQRMARDIAAGAEVNPEYTTCFKALASYYISTRKLGKKQDVGDPPGFDGVKAALAAAANGGKSA